MYKTRITRILDTQKIAYRLLPHSEPVFTVEEAVKQRGVLIEEMVKSILLRDKAGHYVMACVTGDVRLDPKAVRAQLPKEWKRLSFASAEEIFKITGCVKGAVAPVGLDKNVPIIFDEAITHCKKVNISSGDPKAGLELKSEDLIRLTKAKIAPIAESENLR